MKHSKKRVAATLVAALSLTTGLSLAACNGVKEYAFEAENAEITCGTSREFDWAKAQQDQPADPTSPEFQEFWATAHQNPEYYTVKEVNVTVETATEYTGTDEEGPEVTNLGYFYGNGTYITWKITASADCEATLNLRAASASAQMNQQFQAVAMNELTFEEGIQPVTLKVNEEDVTLTGTLPGIEAENMPSDYSYYRNFGNVSATVNLKKGENIITLVAPQQNGMVNVDKIVIKSKAKLSYEPIDNSDRESAM